MTTPENPRAFPLPVSDNNQGYEGIMLRDYFAAKALDGLLSFGHGPVHPWAGDLVEADGLLPVAQKAYEIADAMLAARSMV